MREKTINLIKKQYIMNNKDIEILQWIYDRMECVHEENANYDYMIAFKKTIAKALTLGDVSNRRELLMATLTSRVLTIQNEPDGIVRETMINNLLIDINCG